MKMSALSFIVMMFFLTGICRASIQVSIDGAVGKKGSQEIEASETLWALLYKSNVSEVAWLASVLVTRKTSDGPVYYRVNLKRLLDKSLDFKLKEGDEILVFKRDAFLPEYAKKAILVE